jgi:hypothetical protein
LEETSLKYLRISESIAHSIVINEPVVLIEMMKTTICFTQTEVFEKTEVANRKFFGYIYGL